MNMAHGLSPMQDSGAQNRLAMLRRLNMNASNKCLVIHQSTRGVMTGHSITL